jgi:MtaA/CmuA family methyltransferase
MQGRELIRAVMHGQKAGRTPWVPFTGCHAGALIGVSAADYLRSADLIVKGLTEAVRRYRPDGIPLVFDLQIEAEVLGCDLVWAAENPPSVSSHPLAAGKKIEHLKIPCADQGRIPVALEACRRMRKACPELALYGLITGPFTLALHLLGTDLFMKMYDDQAFVFKLMEFCRDTCIAMAEYYIAAGCDVVAVVDPMTSQIGSDQFRQFVLPYAAPVFAAIRKRNALSSFFVCGQAQQNIGVMCDCGPDNISVDENIPLDFVRDTCLARGLSFGGNLQLTVVLLLGKPDDCRRNAVECMETGGARGYILAPGCDLPYAVPPANLEAVAEVVHDKYRREIVKTMAIAAQDQDTLNLSEYGQTDKVIVDIITLDSEACAPCQYMVEAVRKVAPEFEGIVVWREHKIKHKDAIVFMTSLMVKNVPTICIDGHITFVSRIPPKEDLIAAIQKRINEKLKIKINRRRAALYVLGKNKKECLETENRIKQAIRELGAEVSVQVVTESREVQSFGVFRTPAVALAKYQLKAEGTVPEVSIIKEWLKDI